MKRLNVHSLEAFKSLSRVGLAISDPPGIRGKRPCCALHLQQDEMVGGEIRVLRGQRVNDLASNADLLYILRVGRKKVCSK